jgi:formylglycine-generating enzyme required for sulfatase activity
MKKAAAFLLCLTAAVIAVPLENALYPRMIAVAAGTFLMGSNEAIDRQNERVHEVTVRPFFISETEVTQELYEAVMKENPSYAGARGNDFPVNMVTWFDAVRFCNALSEQTGLPPVYVINGETVSWNREARGYRLPTEAEWEYAARGGAYGATGEAISEAAYAGLTYQNARAAGSLKAGDVAWYNINSGKRAQPVRKKLPNELGLYDMSGNVMEWCWDWLDDYPQTFVYNPEGASSGRKRICRGGSFTTQDTLVKVTKRHSETPVTKAHSIGFRVAQNW